MRIEIFFLMKTGDMEIRVHVTIMLIVQNFLIGLMKLDL